MAATNRRIFVKAVVWRIISTLTTFMLTWLLTSNVTIATQLAVINFFLKTGMQFVYEKIWQRIKWGKGSWLKKKRKKEKAAFNLTTTKEAIVAESKLYLSTKVFKDGYNRNVGRINRFPKSKVNEDKFFAMVDRVDTVLEDKKN